MCFIVHQCYSLCSKEGNTGEISAASKVAPILSFFSFQDVVVAVFQFVGTVSAADRPTLFQHLSPSSSFSKGLRSSRLIASIIVMIIDYVSPPAFPHMIYIYIDRNMVYRWMGPSEE